MPVRNGEASLPPLLESLANQTLASDSFEVVVVDNDSSDRTAEVAERRGARVVREPVANRSRARNRGAAAARAPLYAFTDADCVADPRWLEELLGSADAAPLVAGEVKIHTSEHPNRIERFERLWRFGQEAWVKLGWAATANLLVRKEAFDAVGGFDPSWRHIGEDADFCFRARDAGYGLGYCPHAVVAHEAEREWRPFLRRLFLHGYSVNQAHYRWRLGMRAWRRPLPAVVGTAALRDLGYKPEHFEDSDEWQRMARLARVGYAARIAGSGWAELRRAR